MIGIATALWLSKPLRYAVTGLAMMGLYEGWKFHQRKIGAERATATIEKANDNAIAVGTAAAGKSGVAGMRGKRDPTTRDDKADEQHSARR